MSELLHPELIKIIPFVDTYLARALDDLATSAKAKPRAGNNISVVIRTLNEASSLEVLLQDVAKQQFHNEVEVVVVDNESTDGTVSVAQSFGASVVNIPRDDFTYPRSMNRGIEAASHDIVWLTVEHALPTTRQLLHAGELSFDDSNLAGVYAEPLFPNGNASKIEQWFGLIASAILWLGKREVTKAKLDTMAATSAMLRKSIWKELGAFDERYETGGEDTAMSAKMLRAGYRIKREPVLYVHHSHSLGPVGSIKQLNRWLKTVKGPSELDREKISDLRSHLDFS